MVLNQKLFVCLALMALSTMSFGQSSGQRQWTLEECINYAWENNLTIRTNELTYQSNQIALKESKFAMLPNLSAGGQMGKSFGRTIDPVTNSFISSDFLSGGFSANTSVTLSRGGILRNTIRRNELNLEASDYDVQKSKNDIGLNVATNFLTVLLNKEQLDNARFQLQVSVDQLERTKKLVEAGSLPLTNQLDLESQKATNEVNLVNAENNLSIGILNLKQSMQMSADEQLDIIAPNIDVTDVPLGLQKPVEIYQVALGAQPEIKSADLAVESSDVGVKIAKGAFYPTLSLTGSVSTNYSDRAQEFLGTRDVTVPATPIGFLEGTTTNVLSFERTQTVPITNPDYGLLPQFNDNLGQSLRLNLNIPIFSRYSNRANLQRAQISKQRAEITAMNTRNTLRQSIESAYNTAQASLKSYEATQKRVAALEETFRAAQQRYNVGGVNFVEYQVASNNLFAARTDLVRSKYEYIFRVKILDFYLGNPITLD